MLPEDGSLGQVNIDSKDRDSYEEVNANTGPDFAKGAFVLVACICGIGCGLLDYIFGSISDLCLMSIAVLIVEGLAFFIMGWIAGNSNILVFALFFFMASLTVTVIHGM